MRELRGRQTLKFFMTAEREREREREREGVLRPETGQEHSKLLP